MRKELCGWFLSSALKIHLLFTSRSPSVKQAVSLSQEYGVKIIFFGAHAKSSAALEADEMSSDGPNRTEESPLLRFLIPHKTSLQVKQRQHRFNGTQRFVLTLLYQEKYSIKPLNVSFFSTIHVPVDPAAFAPGVDLGDGTCKHLFICISWRAARWQEGARHCRGVSSRPYLWFRVRVRFSAVCA